MITIVLSKIPESGFCTENGKPDCPYFDNEGGHNTCRLFDLLNVNYTQDQLPDRVINNICTWKNKVVI